MRFAYFLMFRDEEAIRYFRSREAAVRSAREAYDRLSKPDQREVKWLFCADVPEDYEERVDSGDYSGYGQYFYCDLLFEINNKGDDEDE